MCMDVASQPCLGPRPSAGVNTCTAASSQDPDQTDGPRLQVSKVTGQISSEVRGRQHFFFEKVPKKMIYNLRKLQSLMQYFLLLPLKFTKQEKVPVLPTVLKLLYGIIWGWQRVLMVLLPIFDLQKQTVGTPSLQQSGVQKLLSILFPRG